MAGNKKAGKKPGWQQALDEKKIYQRWMEAGDGFAAGKKKGEAYALSLPPPNITGRLHMGHALNATLQDIIARWRRMKGDDVLWQPATDHAGIATQAVVERELAKSGHESRQSLGREAFVKQCWQWRAARGGEILQQLKRLGASCDWQRARFTLDEPLSHAVRHAFCTLFEQKLIYRDTRLVNWDPVLKTAISDLEVRAQEEEGFLWHIRYPAADGGEGLVVATTRPETLFGDAAVAVHPEDRRYQNRIGKILVLPLAGREIPVLADAHADPEAGSGAVKITPAHDFDDYEVGRRHDLPMHDIFDASACLNDKAPPPWRGLERFAARQKVLAALKAENLLVKEEARRVSVPRGDRSNAVIEPRLMLQWFLDVAPMAQKAMQAVKDGKTEFYPKKWEKDFFRWLEDIRPWCLSRQLWWGHQIPVWYGPDGQAFAAMDEAAAQGQAQQKYGKPVALKQDDDVLDTWFSSGLWTFSPLGWPEKTQALARYYPNQVMITGFDILFFWVARMMMLGLHFMDAPPFRHVYLHALVRDEKGEKMTKSRGNVIDPLALIDDYGADALRFFFAAMAGLGRDIKLAPPRIAGYRDFITKIWNAARFCQMQAVKLQSAPPGPCDSLCDSLYDRWILDALNQCIAKMDAALAAYRFNEAADGFYHFFRSQFCDWYLELVKPVLQNGAPAARAQARAVLGFVLAQSLKLAHPLIPFAGEQIWHEQQGEGLLMQQPWPEPEGAALSSPEQEEMAQLMELISAIRSQRELIGIPPGTLLNGYVYEKVDDEKYATIPEPSSPPGEAWEKHKGAIKKLAWVQYHSLADRLPGQARPFYPVLAGGIRLNLDLQGFDIGKMKQAMARKMEEAKRAHEKILVWFEKHQDGLDKIPEKIMIGKKAEDEAALKLLQTRMKAQKILSGVKTESMSQ